MTEAINAHKKMAMGITEGNVMKKGGKVKGYANGGAVSNAAAPNLPAMGDKKNTGVDFKAGKAKIATMKNGGGAKKPGLMIAIAVGRKGAARGR
ncbi:MAG: hypothetical protein WCG15_00650 [Actinomycetes bacterium]|jgi:hypothetical protein